MSASTTWKIALDTSAIYAAMISRHREREQTSTHDELREHDRQIVDTKDRASRNRLRLRRHRVNLVLVEGATSAKQGCALAVVAPTADYGRRRPCAAV